MAEFTILDAPETPAPVFAFRALKGVIFGSPNDDYKHNKENASPQKSVHSLRSKISALRAPPLSPSKRRKTNLHTSPAKSILRTPGIPTPRRQNTNVTFKDVTPSLSPELTRKEPAATKPPPRHGAGDTLPVAQPVVGQTRSKASQNTPIAAPSDKTKASPVAPDPTILSAGFEFEVYRLSTEKEMKKLVRYGQKMREFARKQCEENTKLRIALEKLQRENEELQHREQLRKSERLEKESDGQFKQEAVGYILPARPASKSGTDSVPASQLNENQVDRRSSHASGTGIPSSKLKMNSQGLGQLSPLKRKAITQLRPESSLPQIPSNLAQSNNAKAIGSNNEKCTPTGGHVGARLPLERLAAARERIRMKAERRRATTATTSSPVNWNAL